MHPLPRPRARDLRGFPGILLLCLALAPAVAVAKQALTAADIVAMTRLEQPAQSDIAAGGSPRLITSPDGNYAVLVTSKADIAANQVDYQILLFSTKDAKSYLQSANGAAPQPRVLALFRSPSGLFLSPVRNVIWASDSRSITFLAPGAQLDTAQVFKADIATGAPQQLTNNRASPDSYSFAIDTYSYEESTGRLTYTIRVPDRKIDPDALHFVADTMTANQIGTPDVDDVWMPLYQTYVEGPGLPLRKLGKPHSFWFTNRIWLSPDGRWAIGRVSVTDQATITRWSKSFSPVGQNDLTRLVFERFDPNIMSGAVSFLSRLMLYDVASGEERPLFDAPDGGQIIGGPDSVQVVWSPDSKSVVVGNSFLPLTGGQSVVKRRSRSSFIAEYEIATGRITEIEPVTAKGLFDSIRWPSGDRLEIEARSTSDHAYRKIGNGWIPTAPTKHEASLQATPDVAFEISQSANVPPNVWAVDMATGARKQVSELNPQFRSLSFGRVENFNWQSSDGRAWKGGLLFPPDYQPGRRYPVIVQTYGYKPDIFVIDGFGGMASGYAAQGFANRGMVVLLLPHVFTGTQRQDLFVGRAGIKAALAELDHRGIADLKRVGIIGFSSMGKMALDMITFSDVDFAAASIHDAWDFTLMNYATYLYGFVPPGPLAAEDLIGARPWGKELQTWIERDPSMHTDRIRAALRLEDYGPQTTRTHWDIYVLLRRQHKLVEQITFPKGAHQLRRPAERMESLGGTIDWFDFWLNGHEDPDPRKAEQYRRWHAMKLSREQSAGEARP